MFAELLSIIKGSDPLKEVQETFYQMLTLAQENTVLAGKIAFHEIDDKQQADQQIHLRKVDVKINKYERGIRKSLVTHLTVSQNKNDIPYSMLLMVLAKDIERLGDYAKNVSELSDLSENLSGQWPSDENFQQLMSIRQSVEKTFEDLNSVFQTVNKEKAILDIKEAQKIGQECDAFLFKIAQGNYNALQSTSLSLASRYYKRLSAHLLNILTGVVMPIDQLNYFHEKSISQ